jgi:DNA-binding MarR family transcriptional regulator
MENKIIYAFERVSRAFKYMLNIEALNLGLSNLQAQILLFLYTRGENLRNISSISEEFQLSTATVSEAVNTLKNKGLVKIDRGKDKRNRIISLTDNGIKIVDNLIKWDLKIVEALNELDYEERRQLMLILMKLIYSMYKKGIISLTRMCFTCAYFNSQKSYCNLLNMELKPEDLRIDCKEHSSLAK